jgi:hypothetical protein
MSTPKYEFERYYAELQEIPDEHGNVKKHWIIRHDDATERAKQTIWIYEHEHIAHRNANALNDDCGTGYDSEKGTFTNPEKQEAFMRRKYEEAFAERSKRMVRKYDGSHLKRALEIAEQFNKPPQRDFPATTGVQEEQEAISSMESYEGWATFGSSSTNENNQDKTITVKFVNSQTGEVNTMTVERVIYDRLNGEILNPEQ